MRALREAEAGKKVSDICREHVSFPVHQKSGIRKHVEGGLQAQTTLFKNSEPSCNNGAICRCGINAPSGFRSSKP
jgi:hypothetical protein